MDLSHRIHSFLIMLCLSVVTVYAQQDNVSGRVIDNETKEAMVRATLQLYRLGRVQNGKQDTTFVKGSFTDEEGHFTITGVSAGQYLLKFTFLGYKEQKRDITKARGRQLQLGDITMEADAIQHHPLLCGRGLDRLRHAGEDQHQRKGSEEVQDGRT